MNWTNKRVRIKIGWDQAGRSGVALTEPFQDKYGQFWVAVDWDDEEDPDNYKRVCLEFM